jgi:hypothetical protein
MGNGNEKRRDNRRARKSGVWKVKEENGWEGRLLPD